MRRVVVGLALLALVGCGSRAAQVDAGSEDGGALDSGLADAGGLDAGALDAGELDAGGLDAGELDAGPSDAGALDAGWLEVDAGPVTRVRIATGNLSSGNYQSYDPGEGIRIFEGLQPDVALIQEFNYGTDSDADIRQMIDAAFGTGFAYARGAAGQQIPNGIASRWPIVASGEWTDPQVSNRDFVWARIAVPGGHELFAVSVHLLTSSASSRQAEASALVQDLQQQVPAGDLVVLGGDFNTGTRTESCITTLGAVFATSGPYPADQQGNQNTSAGRTRPLDWVLVDPALEADQAPLQLGVNNFVNGLVFDSRVYTPLTDVPPVLATDSAATNMQHMAVVRAFAIPN